jgi:hypothetical protein
MDLVDLCREFDECLVLEDSTSTQTLALHENMIKQAIAIGSSLLEQISTSGCDISPSGQTAPTLQASLELLRIFHRTRHSQVPAEEVQAVRQRVFNAAA